VGRQIRIDAKDLDVYINKHKTNQNTTIPAFVSDSNRNETKEFHNIVISGQDLVLDIFEKHIEKHSTYKPLRSFTGSLNSLIT